MREILFRGRDIAKNWHYGSLHIECGETDCEGNQCLDHRILGMRGECDYIIPETIGQYSGLTDKNGKKIFEGDIVEIVGEEKELITEKEQKFVVKWQDEDCGFDLLCLFEYEVIGNIHDNPELLKEGAKE